MARVEIKILKVLRDNYVYLLNHRATGVAAVVDAGIAGPIIAALDELNWRPRMLLCTHHHADQIGGNLDMKRAYQCDVFGPADEASRIPGITREVRDGDKVTLGSAWGQVIPMPGHTAGGVGYWFEENKALFCGDILYPLGCGRILESTPEEMWATLKRIRAMPKDTQVYCAHSYIDRHAKFARALNRQDEALGEYARNLRSLAGQGKEGVPFLLADEITFNPFLRLDDPTFQAQIGMADSDPVEVLVELRKHFESR